MKWFNLILRLILGGIFVYAGVEKIIDPAGFAQSISNYQILPHTWINLLAITLPWIETLAGGLLMAGYWRKANTLILASLLIVFIAAIGFAMHRGLNINCGCTNTVGGAKVGWKKLAEDTLWLAMAAWLVWKDRNRNE